MTERRERSGQKPTGAERECALAPDIARNSSVRDVAGLEVQRHFSPRVKNVIGLRRKVLLDEFERMLPIFAFISFVYCIVVLLRCVTFGRNAVVEPREPE